MKRTANDTIILMLRKMNEGNIDIAYKIAENYANSLSENGEIHKAIKRLSMKPITTISDLKGLVSNIENHNENVFFDSDFFLELIKEWKNKELFESHNLPIRNKILLHGPTGNGKTTIARHIAKLAKLPFLEVNSEMVICSQVGTSSKNISEIFNKIKSPCVLFWDEIDSIGRKRGMADSAAGQENERMVNTVLTHIERLSNEVIFIGATNLIEVLDPAFLRRFDECFEIPNPTLEQKELFLKQMESYYKIRTSIDVLGFQNYAEIKKEVLKITREKILCKIPN